MKKQGNYQILVITGPTACGKTALAARVARELDGEVISADSRQVYRGMNLGTGKDYDDYMVDGVQVPYHLIDIVEAGDTYDVFSYQQDFFRVYRELTDSGKFPVVCGGTGLYLEAVLRGYRLIRVPVDHSFRKSLEGKSMEELTRLLAGYKTLHNKTDTDTRKRLVRALEIARYQARHPEPAHDLPDLRPLVVGVQIDRETRRQRITLRLRQRLEAGMVDEVKDLLEKGVSEERLMYYGLEYKYITLYLTGRLGYDEMFSGLETAIHRFAKRQMTWFRGMQRRGIPIHWVDFHLPEKEKVAVILEWLEE
ncbi:MAG TPA: tRNA (adenosine(37)-N6)-dimethylallyltransferase MiaA [Bacteroidetes bacterium]|nr:tRNA (adenosine(37)-N6)-dimethylallyltransferase MiaA [Bacteroidota bacterium]